MDRKFINEITDAASLAVLTASLISNERDDEPDLSPLHLMCHEPAPQAPAHMAMEIDTFQQECARIDAQDYSEPIKTMFDGTGLNTEDELTEGILKIALSSSAAYKTLYTVFMNHKYPQHLDPMGMRIRDILMKLNKGESNGESQETIGSEAPCGG